MRKLLLIVFLFCSSTAYSLNQESAIDQYLKNRKLDNIEGVWQGKYDELSGSQNVIVYKYGNSYFAISISSNSNGELLWSVNRVSFEKYEGTCVVSEYHPRTKKKIAVYNGQNLIINQFSDNDLSYSCSYFVKGYSGTITDKLTRVWPSNIQSYNSKFKKEVLSYEKLESIASKQKLRNSGTTKSSNTRSNGTFKNILGKYLSK